VALNRLRIKVDGQWYNVEIGDLTDTPIEVRVNGEAFLIEIEPAPQERTTHDRRTRSVDIENHPVVSRYTESQHSPNENILRSPMPGRVMSINVRPGDSVREGDEVCVVEAMKMEQSIRAPRAGIIKAIHVQPLDSVNANDPLVELE
jgi:propionyl-CoA carboxylase alpha chain